MDIPKCPRHQVAMVQEPGAYRCKQPGCVNQIDIPNTPVQMDLKSDQEVAQPQNTEVEEPEKPGVFQKIARKHKPKKDAPKKKKR